MIASILIWLALVLFDGIVLLFAGGAVPAGILVCLVAVPVCSWALNWLARGKISTAVKIPLSTEKGKTACGTIVVHSQTWLPVVCILVKLELCNLLTGERSLLWCKAAAAPKERTEVPFTFTASHCGHVSVKIARVQLMDLFGLLPVPCPAGAAAGAAVLPHTFPTEVLLTITPRNPDESDAYSDVKRGYDYSETFQIREYADGDCLKQIHWKLSSKWDKLIVRDPSFPVTRSLLIFWDKSAGSQAPAPEVMDALAEVSVSLAQALAEEGMVYHLGWNDTQNGQCVVEEITDSDKLSQCIPRMMKAGRGGETMAGTTRYLTTRGVPNYARIVYLSAAVPADLTEFTQASQATALLCTQQAVELPMKTITFTPESYLQTLQIMELDE